MDSKAYKTIEEHWLSYKLAPISIRELLLMGQAPSDIYSFEDGVFHAILARNAFINKDVIKALIDRGRLHLFVRLEDLPKYTAFIQSSLTSVTRTLSMGNPFDKGKRLMMLLTLHMSYLYKQPTNDDCLKLQFQSAKNLAYFLMNKVDLHAQLYHDYIKQKNHYVLAQPMISSLFVLGIMKHAQLYADKDIESLFLVSYFKDIGMCSVPVEKYDLDRLSEADKDLLINHPTHSIHILQNRIPLTYNHLSLIENHHSFSLLQGGDEGSFARPKESETLIGFETIIINIMDVIAAMITGRPYRKAQNLYEALELVRSLIADKHPQEFRLIVSYFKSFFLTPQS